MNVVARAKINLWLSVGSRRPDGYHEISSVMQSLTLADDLEITPLDAEMTLDVVPAGSAPLDDSNLVVRAASAMRIATGATAGAAMRLTKRIPSGAGLAGGSADAAAALVGLNELWGARLSRKAIERIGATVGADVPFCVRGGTASARGIGTDLSPLACPRPLWWAIASDGTALSTEAVYGALGAVDRGVDDPAELADALARSDPAAIASLLRNDLAPAALRIAPSIASVRDALIEAGALGVVMTGSGSAWCGLARDEADAHRVDAAVEPVAAWSAVASSAASGAAIVR